MVGIMGIAVGLVVGINGNDEAVLYIFVIERVTIVLCLGQKHGDDWPGAGAQHRGH